MPTAIEDVYPGLAVNPSAADAPAGPTWFGDGGVKLNTAAWLQHGVDTPAVRNAAVWHFDSAPAPSHHLSNYPTVLDNCDTLGRHFDEMLSKGLTEAYDPAVHGPLEDFATVISPLHVVTKADGDLRPIIDPTRSGVNACMSPLPCPLPSLSTILRDLPANGALGKRDVASAFHHIILDPSARRYMAFRHPVTNAIQRWVVLPFGASQSPAIWVELANAACRIFQDECDRRGLNIKIHVYADDFMLLGATHDDVVAAFEVMDSLGADLGLEWKAAKDAGRDTHLQEIEFLGMWFDSAKLEMRISPSKRERYAADVRQLLQDAASGAVPRRHLLSVTGKLGFIAQACRWGPSFLQSLYDAAPTPSPRLPPLVRLTEEAVADLQFWLGLLDCDHSPWDGVRRCIAVDLNVVLGEFEGPEGAVVYTDASAAGFGAVWEDVELQGPWQQNERDAHIAWLELKAILRALQAWAPGLAGRRVLVRCDNTQAVAALNRGSTRVREGRGLMRQVAELALSYRFEVRALHIAGVDNGRADRLSRRLDTATEQNYVLLHALYRAACKAAQLQPEVDGCCDVRGLNRQPGCGSYYSAAASVLEQADALAGRTVWAFPPQQIVGEVLALLAGIRSSGTRALVLVPEWQERGWFREWVRSRQSPYRVLQTLPMGGCHFRLPGGRLAGPSPYAWLVLCMK
ncbi:hypothetical protein CHLRE_05g243351v5 [Chlamydomonas reinhardtii]|uniref:Reverse transcriptase domain-containing protein n=1 Tax=Chlamydomonas reinhardtii TaxID=3055 RepID=A0A2K3DSD1_CHLRE|nr:uncharacterized protein CHLRE_05g243351v5 [Chlamydomonas reinhardtii]PNW83443.1 hypothetical protein CHLRE_05g243351v5 [Chlamydomonas reinhardtii]